MRDAFVKSITEVALVDEQMILLTADVGFKIFNDFVSKFPNRFFNVGIAEANMIGVAAGLALEGFNPFVYSIAPFVTLRCYEQIRNDVAYHKLNVKVVGVGGGLSYGYNGATHHVIEDIAIFRAMPNMIILCPGDPCETYACVKFLANYEGPAYLRLGRAGEPNVYVKEPTIELGKGIILRQGDDVALISTGNMLFSSIGISEELKERNIGCSVISMPTVKPLDEEIIEDLAHKVKLIVSLEEHNILGGLGSAIAEHLAEMDKKVKFRRFGIPDCFASVSGDQDYLRKKYGLGVQQIVSQIIGLLR